MSRPRVPCSGPLGAKLAVVGMAPASNEVRHGMPFVGDSGQVLNKSLQALGVPRESVFVTNLLDYPIPHDSIYDEPRNDVELGIERVRQELLRVRPNVVLLCGNDPLRALCSLGPGTADPSRRVGIQSWRGSILESTLIPGQKCVAAMHPASFIRGLWKWLPVFRAIDLARAVDESKSPLISLPKRTAITGPSLKMVFDYIDWLATQPILSVDIETNDTYQEIACIGLGARVDEAICIPFLAGGGFRNYWTTDEEILIWRAIANLFQSGIPIIGQNVSFDFLHFWKNGLFPHTLLFDTRTQHQCLYPDFGVREDLFGKRRDPDSPGHGLAFINSQYTRTPFYKEDGRRASRTDGDRAFWEYNCKDVMCTLDCGWQMTRELGAKGLTDYYQDNYVRPFWHALEMEWTGVQFDTERRDAARVELKARSLELGKMINDSLGYDLNLNSPKQMKKFLYEERGYQVRINPKTRKATTDKHALSYFAQKKGDQVLEFILEKRQIDDLVSDLLNQKLDEDGRIHTQYKIGGTNGTRWSSTGSILGSGTNLQNIPKTGIARKLFLAG